uniref:ABC transmembrane type-2 domain-containing protein n=1 Tax=Anotrichium furcellatum TaxID=41999 RepID=A0A4D6WL57_9FLOR|nr:hypothetical protein [Anotrichium furcellatum]
MNNSSYNIDRLKPKQFILHKIFINELIIEIKALTRRLYIQTYRRPSTLLVGVIQPLLWIILFSALFQKTPITLFNNNIKYHDFLSPGILIFTVFNGSINAGLPTMFDREFGFLNRILVSPLNNKYSIILASMISTWMITINQLIVITIFNIIMIKNFYIISCIYQIISLSTLIIISIASISICLAFILPGHIEFLGFILITNLPILFSSTALAPLQFMPYWLQILTCLNPLTYAIEILRYIHINGHIDYNHNIIKTIWINLNINHSILILIIINIINLIFIKYTIKYKYE